MTGIEADLAVAVDEWTNATCPIWLFLIVLIVVSRMPVAIEKTVKRPPMIAHILVRK
jgi:hypothetical protein